jgi:hypothetical protein
MNQSRALALIESKFLVTNCSWLKPTDQEVVAKSTPLSPFFAGLKAEGMR